MNIVKVDRDPEFEDGAEPGLRSESSSSEEAESTMAVEATEEPEALEPAERAGDESATASTPAASVSQTSVSQTEPSKRLGANRAEANAVAKPSARTKLIKRYSNRKLYDTTRSKYVTLDEIARMVQDQEDVSIIDNETKEDLTSVTLTQIIYEQEKAARRMPLSVLRGIIQTSGETLNEFFDRSAARAQKSVGSSVTELRQSALSMKEAAARQFSELTESARRFFSREERRAEEFKRAITDHADQLEQRVADRIRAVQATRSALEQHDATSQPGPPGPGVDDTLERNTHTLDHVDTLRTRLAALSVLTDRLEGAARGTHPTSDEDA